jgi:ribonuclease HI
MLRAECNNVQLLKVLGHKDNESNGTADQLARRGPLLQLIGPEPACGISETAAKQAIKVGVCREHQEY